MTLLTTPSEQAMEAARKFLGPQSRTSRVRLAAALDAYAAERIEAAVMDVQRQAAVQVAGYVESREAAEAERALLSEANHATELKLDIAEERVRVLESWRAKAINLYPELDDRASLLAGEAR